MSQKRTRLIEQLSEVETELTSIDKRWACGLRIKAEIDRKNELEAVLARLRVELADVDDRQAEVRDAADKAAAELRLQLTHEDAAFWYRRWVTTLSIGHAGAFAALASGFLQAENQANIAAAVAEAMQCFAIGMVCAGAVPFFLWSERFHAEGRTHVSTTAKWVHQTLTMMSAGLFVIGLMTAIGAVRGLGA